MKKILITLGIFITMSLGATAQTVTDEVDIETSDVKLEVITPAEQVKETEKEIKQREKLLREHANEIAYAKAFNSMKRGYFVLVADAVELGRFGYRIYNINRYSNFVLVQNDDGIVQFAINTGDAGSNGLGGQTGKGQVRNKKIKEKNNGDVFMQFQIVGAKIHTDVDVTLYHNSNRAMARVWNGSSVVTFYGDILPYRDNDHR